MASKPSKETVFKPRHRLIHRTTTVYHLSQSLYSASYNHHRHHWTIAAVDGDLKPRLLHPLTVKPHHFNLPSNFDLSKLNPSKTAVSHETSPPFDKFLVVSTPTPLSDHPFENDYTKKNIHKCTLFSLRDGGRLWGCLPSSDNWDSLTRYYYSADLFDDITIFKRKIYVVDRRGSLHVVNIYLNTPSIVLSKKVVDQPVAPPEGRLGWRKRLVNYANDLYIVVRTEKKMVKVFKLVVENKVFRWEEVTGFGYSKEVLFMGKDHYFRSVGVEKFPGKEYKNCIVFTEGAFPGYGKDGWVFSEFGSEDDIAVFRLSDGVFAREGENKEFPKIEWGAPPWILKAWSVIAAKFQTCLSPELRTQSKREIKAELADSDTKDGEVQSKLKDGELKSDLVGQDKELEEMTSVSKSSESSDIHDRDGKMQCDSDGEQNEDEEVNDGNGQGTLTKNITKSIPRACTTKSHENDTVTTKFEGLDIRSDLVTTLQMIWRKHGNIIENSSIRSGALIGRALESLATVVRILEDNSAQSLSSSEADFLSSTLSDLRYMHFKVNWLVPFVEKVVKLHKSKHLLDSLNNLSQLSSKAKKRKVILIEELTKIGEEENKLKEEMTKVSKMIPFSGRLEFDKPVGSGLT